VDSTPEPETSYRALFRIPSMGRILLGMALSRIAGSMLGVALVLFTLDRFGSPGLAGLVTFAGTAPGLLVAPIVGALLDRHGRTRLIILDQLTAAVCLVAIASLTIAGLLTPLLLVAISAVAGLTAPLSNVGLRTLFPLIVPRHLWERVNAVDSNGYVLATLVGPPVAGVMVQLVGAPQALYLIAALYAVSTVAILRVPDPASAGSNDRLLVAAWDGLRYTISNPTLRGLGVTLTIQNLAWGIISIALPVILLQNLGLGGAIVGIVWAVSGVTGGIGALMAGQWRVQGRERPMLVWPIAGMAVSASIVLLSPTLPVILGVMAVQGFLNGPMDVAMFTLRQRRTDPAWLGRAFAVSMSFNFLGYPFGAALGGVLVGYGTNVALAAAVAFTVLSAVVGWVMLPRENP
jgi:MFS family permease